MYAIHQPLLGILISALVAIGLEVEGSWAVIASLFVAGSLISYGIYWLLDLSDITSTIFLGKRKIKKQ